MKPGTHSESHVMMKAEAGVMQLQAKEWQIARNPPEAMERQRKNSLQV